MSRPTTSSCSTATQPLNLTTSRTYETGIKQVLWGNKAEWSLSVFDIQRENVYAAAGGMTLNIAGRENAKGVEIAGAIRPTTAWKFWGNFAYVDARYADYDFAGGSFSGNTPPNVPQIVANAGASYRFETTLPVELGLSARYVGNRFNSDANTVIMDAYTVADAYVFVDIPKYVLPGRRSDPRHVPGSQPVRPAICDLGRSVLSRPDPARRAANL